MAEHAPLSRPMTRRGLLTAAGVLGIGALAAACGSGGSSSATSGGGSWSFTDDRGQKATANGKPQHIAAYIGSAAALSDFGVTDQITGVFGPTKLANGSPDQEAGSVNVNKVAILGNAYGEFDVEKYASLHPDLLVTNMYEPHALWFVPDASKDQIARFAPSIGFRTSHVVLTEPIQRYAQLAVALGADPQAKQVVDAKARFDSATSSLRSAIAANPGITVVAASASQNLFYVADPTVYADLGYFRQLGLGMVPPNHVTGGFFESLSWENANKYAADLILLDNRTQAAQPAQLTSKSVWADLPAVRAGQITPWPSEPRFSYAGCAPFIETLAAAIRAARKVH
jgi:iron complex transport system substrate-binding protein